MVSFFVLNNCIFACLFNLGLHIIFGLTLIESKFFYKGSLYENPYSTFKWNISNLLIKYLIKNNKNEFKNIFDNNLAKKSVG